MSEIAPNYRHEPGVMNLCVHHSKKVKAWLDERRERIEVFFLPAYAPELNPDEYLNGDLKQQGQA